MNPLRSLDPAAVSRRNAELAAEQERLRNLTPEERRRHMEAKAAGRKSPIIMDEFKRLGLITENSNDNPTRIEIPNPELKRDERSALGGTVSGEEKSLQRTRVRFILFRVRPLDPDNAAGSVKNCVDGLRHAGLIPGDEPWRIILETEQVKVAHFKEEKTEVEITIL